jgi:hypothetical protein
MLDERFRKKKTVEEDRFSGENGHFHQRWDYYKYQKGGMN